MVKVRSFSQRIKQHALSLGFNACGISKAAYLPDEAEHLKGWLQKGCNAEMKYLENNFEKRVDPVKLIEGAKSVISVIINYYPEQVQKTGSYKISKYAYGEDYHKVLKNKLEKLFEFIKSIHPAIEGKCFVDSAPVLEKAWAHNAGLGWIGKHSLLINKEFGSFVFIGELIINLELEYDKPVKDYCGDCGRCIEACPTKAIIAPRIIDSNKCIAYHTIENKGEINTSLKGKFNNWIFGCDICQEACPWNQRKICTTEVSFIKNKLPDISGIQLEKLTEKEFNEIFKNSPIIRTGLSGFKRNIKFVQDC